MRSSLELVIQERVSMCKILPTTFKGSVHAWYNNLEPNSIERFSNLCTKPVEQFSTSIPAKKNST
jgi:hypothetical protein